MPPDTLRLLPLVLCLAGCFPPPLTCEERPGMAHCALEDGSGHVDAATASDADTSTTNDASTTTDTAAASDTTINTDTTIASAPDTETDAALDTGPTCATDCSTNVPTCREPGVCRANGQCEYPVAGDGTECDDGDRCTAIDVCDEGACVGSGTPLDAINDFASGLWADGGLSIHGLAVSDVAWLLVSFPNDTAVERPELHMHSTGGTDLTLALPNGVVRGLALIRTTLRGVVEEGRIVATGDASLVGTGLAVTSVAVVVAGRASTSVQLDVSATLDSDHDFAFMAAFSDGFALRHHHRIDARFPAARFIVGPTSCLALVPTYGAETVEYADGTGFTRQTTGPDGIAGMVWLVGIPQCGQVGTFERWLLPSDETTAVLPSDATTLRAGGSAIAVGHHGFGVHPALAASATTSIPASEDDAMLTSVLRLDASGDVLWNVAISDTTPELGAALPLIFGRLAARDASTTFMTAAGSRAFVTLPSGQTMPIAGNPPLPSDYAPRTWILTVAPDGSVEPMYVTNGAEKGYAVFSSGAADTPGDGDRLLVAGVYGQPSIGNAPGTIDLGVNGGTFAGAIDGLDLVWGTKIVEPLDGSRWLSKSLFVQSVPETRGAIVAGDLGVPAALGRGAFPREFDPGPASGAFLMRINSNDGVGCGP